MEVQKILRAIRRRGVPDWARHIGRRLLRRRPPTVDIEPLLNREGEGIINFIDVGSDGGLPDLWLPHAGLIHHLVNFEPRNQTIMRQNCSTLNVALWSRREERNFYIYEGLGGSGSSLFKQNTRYVRENFESLRLRGPRQLAESWFDRASLVRTERIECYPLDTVLEEHQLDTQPYHFIKIDAQGAESEILKGAMRTLDRGCIGLQLELFTLPMYQGIQLLPEVKSELAGLGFELIKLFPAHGTFHSQHDCVFLRPESDVSIVRVIKKVYGLDR